MKKKTNKIANMSQTHGKVEEFKPSTLDQIWGDTGLSKYQTFDLEKYEEYIRELNKTDLQAHASKVGVIPTDSVEMTRKRLLAQFRKHVSNYRTPNANPSKPSLISKEVRKILEEGK